ncbi:uncharacterized protein LOC126589633 [Malus sylvestris]|uniref:uncharacterized protein LOC126589633 n=1 Tax=Malus sylvestris TaxID=3752 RepID=UPI0021AC14FF|nr:uncharacterized protein LOC126589633 [Malus sylvestris]
MPDTPSTSTTDALRSQQAKKNTWGTCRQLKTTKITWVTNRHITIRYNDRHRATPTVEQHSALAHNIGHIVRIYCPMQWKYWKVMPDEVRTKVSAQLSTNYNFEDINDDMLVYVNGLFSEWYKQWKSDLHQYFETFNDPQVALEEGCPMKFEGWEDNWAWLCSYFHEPRYVKVKANKSNREKKTFPHHFGSKPFSYKIEARQRRVQNSQRLMSLTTFTFDLGISWSSPFM